MNPHVQLHGEQVLLAAHGRRELAMAFARLPSARAFGRPGTTWLLPASAQAAAGLREVLAVHPDLQVEPDAAQWLSGADGCIGTLDIAISHAEPRLQLQLEWGTPPSGLLPALATAGTGHSAPLTPENLRAVAPFVSGHGLQPTLRVEQALEWLAAHPDATSVPAGELDAVDDDGITHLIVHPVYDRTVADAFFAQEARLLRQHRKVNRDAAYLPATSWPTEELSAFVQLRRLAILPQAERAVAGLSRAAEEAARLIAMSEAEDAELAAAGLAGELLPFQRAGVVYALERRRLLIADEQGLGKTVQALATLQADGAFPAIIVCPASLKLNWLREAARWLPQRTAVVLDAGTPTGDAEIVILNYEGAAAGVPELTELEARALVLDEAHYVKNFAAQRTKAVLALSAALAPGALRLALTGTPVVNRPAELAPQLQVLDRLDEFGTAASFGSRYETTVARRRLHEKLRASCFLRRRKADVLAQLPPKQRAVLALPIDNAEEYRLAEQRFVQWLAEQAAGAGLVPDELRASAFARLAALRRLAAEGKLAAAVSWVEDFAESDERLVLFAHHRAVQAAVLQRFPGCARILGSDSVEEREANVRRFQDGGEDAPWLCVCSLEAASHGFTLTAAANVAFLELAWTPAKHDQAEDRLHRIGQTAAVTAWYLLAAGTIDERIARLLDEKRRVVDAVTDGAGEDGDAVLTALLRGYARG